MVFSTCTTYRTQVRKATVEQSWIPHSVSDKRLRNERARGCGA